MNTRNITAIAFLLAALGANLGVAKATPQQPYAFPVKTALCRQHPIRVGTIQQDVVNAFGLPDLRASNNVWIYDNSHAQGTTPSGAHGCTILVVTFTHARVADIKLVNPSAAKLIAAGAKSGTVVAFVPDRKALPTLVADRR